MHKTELGTQAGSRFGSYQLTTVVRRDIASEVYQAEDTRNDDVVALTVIAESLSSDQGFRTRFDDEAQAASQVREPHMVAICEYGDIDGQLYLQTSVADGVELAAVLADGAPLSAPRAVAIVRQVAAALDAAHDADVVHRDIKPANILLTGDDLARLQDFGLAAALAEPGVSADPQLGTLAYMAPERLIGERVTHLADVYSLACVLAECLSGARPFTAETVEAALAERRTAATPRPSTLRPGRVPAGIDDVLARGLALKPEDRYSSAGELAAAAYAALTEPERHQVTRILRRGDAALHLPGGLHAEPPTDSVSAWDDVTGGAQQPDWSGVDLDVVGPAEPFAGTTLGPADMPLIPRPTRRLVLRKPVVIVTAALAAVALVVGIAHAVGGRSSSSPVASPPQQVLPFRGDYRLSPGGVALDSAGNVYVASEGMHGRVVKLQANSEASTVLPSSDQYQPRGLVVDSSGNVYFTDANSRVIKLPADNSAAIVLPFSGLQDPDGVAVDAAGDVYVADRGSDSVVRLDGSSNAQSTLPFTGLVDPDGVAVDSDGNVYVTDTGNDRVLKMPAGSIEQAVVPFGAIVSPWGIAVDGSDNLYVTERNRNKVVKLPAGAAIPQVLPFTGLNAPADVAVDDHGNVYVADRGNDRVVKVDAHS